MFLQSTEILFENILRKTIRLRYEFTSTNTIKNMIGLK